MGFSITQYSVIAENFLCGKLIILDCLDILSYPSDFPAAVFELMPTIPLGELIICHEVMVREAAEQDKTVAQHISHLLIHGVLHLFGFDHMTGQAEQDEMESFEIDILERLALPNPYLEN